jgi:hypothetical protein
MYMASNDQRSWRYCLPVLLALAVLTAFPGDSSAQNRKRNNRGNQNNRNRQQAAARAKAQAAAQVKVLTAQLKVVDAQYGAVSQRLGAAQSQLQALQQTVGEMRQVSDTTAAEAFDAKQEVLEIEKQLEEEVSPGSKLGQARVIFEKEKVAYSQLRKQLGAKQERNISETERDKIIDADLAVVLKRKIMLESQVALGKERLKVFNQSADWKNAREVLQESSLSAGTSKRSLDKQISGYNKVRHVVLVARRDLAAVAQTKKTLEAQKAVAQKKARSTGGSSRSNGSSNRKR